MNVVGIIQARMTSTRLPGKVLKEINNKPLIEYEINRLKKARQIDQLVIATTINNEDDSIVEFCEKHNLKYFRGSEKDVLSRYYETAKTYNADIVVRLTSDCPIIDPTVVDDVITTFINNEFDYVSNTLKRTYPRGMDTEVFTFNALEKAFQSAKETFEKEHVTPYIYLNPETFNLYSVEYSTDESMHRWTVDTIEDFLLIEKIIKNFNYSLNNFSMEDVLIYLNENPEIKKINEDIKQKRIEL